MPRYHKIPERKQKQEELVYDDRIRAIIREYADIGYTYTPDREEKEALIFQKYKQKFASTYSYDLQQSYRIKHQNNEFLVYRVNEEVIDSNNQIRSCERRVGFHSSPVSRPAGHNEFGEVTGTQIVGQRLVYEIPFDKDKLRELIQNSKSLPTCLAVGLGSNNPPDIISGWTLSIFNTQEFIEESFDDLYEANQKGFLKREHGGVKAYKAFKESQSQSQHVT